MPIASRIGPISFARKIDAGMDVLSLRRHDPDQVQRVPAVSRMRVSQLLDRSSPRNAANVGLPPGVSTQRMALCALPRSIPVARMERSAMRGWPIRARRRRGFRGACHRAARSLSSGGAELVIGPRGACHRAALRADPVARTRWRGPRWLHPGYGLGAPLRFARSSCDNLSLSTYRIQLLT